MTKRKQQTYKKKRRQTYLKKKADRETRSDILQGEALFRGVKQLRRCLVMLNNFEKFSFPSIEKRWTKDKETDGQKEKRKTILAFLSEYNIIPMCLI